MAGVYLHIPFCKRLCAYCDFYKSVRLALIDEVVFAMHRELLERRDYLHDRKIETLYFGGGTPSLVSVEQLAGLKRRVEELFDCSSLDEVTLEANPDDLNPAYLAGLREAGFNRLSIGIQSFDDEELRWMNRRHTARQAEEVVREARDAGFSNLTIDLIFGVPGFGEELLRRSLDRALALDVEHISAYHLTIEPDTALGRREARGELHAVEETVSEREYALVHETLTAAGYEHYEISNYARPGFRARHNSAYWRGSEYLGIGPAAHSFDGSSRCWSLDTVESYISAEPFRFECEELSARDRLNEYLMTRLRTAEGISYGVIAERFGAASAERIRREAAQPLSRGLLSSTPEGVKIPAEHFLLSDHLIGMLFEPEQ
ncbi:MAG: radical SAM family heme chaperone HemW [Rikenellaceae bacterium]|nr:radical SAM family heme chaperone HemW [Rikenellaceae bacterium]